MSAPRPPSSAGEPAAEPLGELEELDDDAIIAQQTLAHAPRPRVTVAEESRSVVIREQPPREELPRPPRSSAEATLVIRDRRALDDLRAAIQRKKAKQARDWRPWYLWGALGLTAFVLGGIAAFLATTDSHSGAEAAMPPTVRTERPIAPPIAEPLPAPQRAALKAPAASRPPEPNRPVLLDDLPLESPSRR